MTNKKLVIFIFLFLELIFLNINFVSSDVYMGTCEGHVYNTEGQVVSGARVVATVDRCVVSCSQETTTDSNGYYVTANLNLPKRETLTVYAEKYNALYGALEFGQATGIANDYQAAAVDVVICLPPPQSTLVDEPNTHDTFATLEWTSYPDIKGLYSVYDEFQIDSQPVIIKNGAGYKTQDITGLTFSSHTWKVRTCTQFCCSAWSSDSFTVGNSPPSPPILVDQLDTSPGNVNLDWTSGIDPEGDETYDEYCFGIINQAETCSITAPIKTEEVFSCNYYQWRVRTCEKEVQHLCSQWSNDGFIACGLSCPECISSGGGGGGGGGGGCGPLAQPYSVSLMTPPKIAQWEKLPIFVTFTTSAPQVGMVFRINSSDFNFNDFWISQLNYKEARFNMSGKPKDTVIPGIYNLTFNIYVENKKGFELPFVVEVTPPPTLFIKINKKLVETPRKTWLWIIILTLIIITALIMLILKYKEKKKNLVKKVVKKAPLYR